MSKKNNGGVRNKASDLNDSLFGMLERLDDDELMKENGEMELKRAQAMATISSKIIDNGRLILDAQKHADEYGYGYGELKDRRMPRLLQVNDSNDETN